MTYVKSNFYNNSIWYFGFSQITDGENCDTKRLSNLSKIIHAASDRIETPWKWSGSYLSRKSPPFRCLQLICLSHSPPCLPSLSKLAYNSPMLTEDMSSLPTTKPTRYFYQTFTNWLLPNSEFSLHLNVLQNCTQTIKQQSLSEHILYDRYGANNIPVFYRIINNVWAHPFHW